MITINKQPQAYSTLNDAIFKVTSNRENILQFKVTVYDAPTSKVLFQKKYAILPMVLNGTYFNIAPELSSFVDYGVTAAEDLLKPIENTLRSYNVEIVEIYRNADGNLQEGDTLFIAQPFYIWNAFLSTIDFANFNNERYIATSGDTLAVFLNKKPLVNKAKYSEVQILYYITKTPASAVITLYKKGGAIIGSHTVAGILPNAPGRLAVSPQDLELAFGDTLFTINGSEFTDEFTEQFGNPETIADADYYTVKLIDNSGNDITETRTFTPVKSTCAPFVDILFNNNLGGFDSLSFYNPKQSVSVARKTIDANPYQFDGDGNLEIASDGIYNPEKVVISTEKTSSFSAISDVLNNNYALYAKGIIEAERVFVKLKNGNLYPVTIQQADYDINNSRLNTNNNRLSITFNISDVNLSL